MLLAEYMVATAGALGVIGVLATCLSTLWQRGADAPREIDETA